VLAGFDCDYTRYPGSEAQALFFRHYMAASGAAGDNSADGATLSDEQLARFSAEANLFALASHIYWGVWALIQARCVIAHAHRYTATSPGHHHQQQQQAMAISQPSSSQETQYMLCHKITTHAQVLSH
jgi:hypothetical protein